MANSRMFKPVKRYYERGYYSKDDVKSFVGVDGGLTVDEYKQIVGESYSSDKASSLSEESSM